jgi:hypothetical protein
MEKTINHINMQHLCQILRSLGYYPIKRVDRTSEWRKSQYHLYTHPFGKKGIKLSLHKDMWTHQPPNFKHKATKKNEDVKQELEKIHQKCKQTTQAMFNTHAQ